MTASVHRRHSFRRGLLALGGLAVVALVALAAFLLVGALTDGGSTGPEVHANADPAIGEPDHATPAVRAIHQQPSTRARGAAFAVLAAAVVIAAWTFHRLRLQRARRLRTLRIAGLPPGRGPPTPRIA